MAKAISTLDWCVVRLGEDHNWWVAETSDPVRWDVDGLSIVDPRQLQHLIELVDPLRDYGFDQDVFEAAFIPFRIEKDLGSGKVRLKRMKESLFDSEEKLFALPEDAVLKVDLATQSITLPDGRSCRIATASLFGADTFRSRLACTRAWVAPAFGATEVAVP